MRRQAIDFAPRSFARTFGRTFLISKVLGLVGLGFCLVGGLSVKQSLDRLGRVEDEVLRLEQQQSASRKAAQGAVPEVAISEGQAAAVNAAVKQLNLPWRDVLDAVEAGTPKSMGLLALEPDAKRNVVKIAAEATGSIDMIGYVDMLKLQPFLTSAFVIKHLTDENGGERPLQFEVEASWRGSEP
jgi:hypothetical protein